METPRLRCTRFLLPESSNRKRFRDQKNYTESAFGVNTTRKRFPDRLAPPESRRRLVERQHVRDRIVLHHVMLELIVRGVHRIDAVFEGSHDEPARPLAERHRCQLE